MNINTIRKIILCTLLILLNYTIVFSQKLFKKCTIEDYSQNKTEGFINVRDFVNEATQFQFKENDASKIVTYTPKQIKYLYLDNQVYMGALVEIEYSPDEMNTFAFLKTIESDSLFNITKKEVFLKQLVGGTKSLYILTNKDWRKLFYIEDSSQLKLLRYKRFLNDKNEIIENNLYKNELNYYFENNSKLASNLEELEYTEKKIVALFRKYYNISKLQYTVVKEKSKTNIRLGVNLLSNNDIINAKKTINIKNIQHQWNTKYTIGFHVDINYTKLNNQWTIHNNLFYDKSSIRATIQENSTASKYIELNYRAICM
jgi:hypothetical protein